MEIGRLASDLVLPMSPVASGREVVLLAQPACDLDGMDASALVPAFVGFCMERLGVQADLSEDLRACGVGTSTAPLR